MTRAQQSVDLSRSVGLVNSESLTVSEPLELSCGEKLNHYELVYETYGELNADKSNAILVCHALSGNHHLAGFNSQAALDKGKATGWWDKLVGPGKVIDTNRFFVVCSNNIGGCHGSTGPKSINPSTSEPYGPDFPMVTVTDWVNSQAQLSDALGVNQWCAIVGGSLGAMQVQEWAIRYPDKLKHAIVIASASKLTAQNIAFNEVARQAIRTDPNFHEGRYFDHESIPFNGLRLARMLGHITYLSDNMMAQKFGRALRNQTSVKFEFSPEFEIESYLQYQADRFAESFDANTYLIMTKALDYFDPAGKHGDNLSVAYSKISADFLVISFSTDWRFAPSRSKEIVKALQDNNLNVSYADIKADHGHDSFLLEIDEYIDVFAAYMNRVASSFEIKGFSEGNNE